MNDPLNGSTRNLFNVPKWIIPRSKNFHSWCTYLSGALFASSILFFLDSLIYSHRVNASDIVSVTFTEWIPMICSTLGMIIINSVDKSNLTVVSSSSATGGLLSGGGGGISIGGNGGGNSNLLGQLRIVLFLGFALLAGGCSGSIVVLIVKYIQRDITEYPTLGMGVDNVIANMLILLSCVVLWVAQTINFEDEYNYALTL
ncbi:Vps68p SCDLUD_005021 [Saccharomycodes ludwigii]|uniref:Vps68p n=1 Tax=Saccharomycodes ludwigii TaxID=36035 RepID=UPI001E89B771|nr:hypothetical protein SCDLUD_005021 [Saccharomycodes ludwigii]KAH3898698.1 hypothetical protein SCDLUD_005021 [Saccharomycodes ludwigii]